MTDEDALRIGRKAVEDARRRVGDDRNALMEEIGRQIESDPERLEAFALAGHLILRSLQETRH